MKNCPGLPVLPEAEGKGGSLVPLDCDNTFQLIAQDRDKLQSERAGPGIVQVLGKADTVISDDQFILTFPHSSEGDPDGPAAPLRESVFQGVGDQFIDD